MVWVASVSRNPIRTVNSCRTGRVSLAGSCTAATTLIPTARPCDRSKPRSCSISVRILRSVT
ncbi:Uncharacterised protein [Mycobacteroides abscessus subsp. abscessus]|nr:Uncharacterised protein [Mycobacteroides abscessus subsp. abscessus]